MDALRSGMGGMGGAPPQGPQLPQAILPPGVQPQQRRGGPDFGPQPSEFPWWASPGGIGGSSQDPGGLGRTPTNDPYGRAYYPDNTPGLPQPQNRLQRVLGGVGPVMNTGARFGANDRRTIRQARHGALDFGPGGEVSRGGEVRETFDLSRKPQAWGYNRLQQIDQRGEARQARRQERRETRRARR